MVQILSMASLKVYLILVKFGKSRTTNNKISSTKTADIHKKGKSIKKELKVLTLTDLVVLHSRLHFQPVLPHTTTFKQDKMDLYYKLISLSLRNKHTH